MLRIDPAIFDIAVAYRPGQPQTLAEWQAETDATIVMNGGFYTPEFEATAVVVVDGIASGSSYRGFGGMLIIEDSEVTLRSLADWSYDPAAPIDFGLQSFPVLIEEGKSVAYSGDNKTSARRSVIAQDRHGRILFIVAPWGAFELDAIGRYLAQPEYEIEFALNLDGGASTGLLLEDPSEGYPSFTAIPSVIWAKPK